MPHRARRHTSSSGPGLAASWRDPVRIRALQVLLRARRASRRRGTLAEASVCRRAPRERIRRPRPRRRDVARPRLGPAAQPPRPGRARRRRRRTPHGASARLVRWPPDPVRDDVGPGRAPPRAGGDGPRSRRVAARRGPHDRPHRRGLAVADRAGRPRGHCGRGVRRPRGRAGRHTPAARVVPRRHLALRRRDGLGASRPGAALRRPDRRARGRARVVRRHLAAGGGGDAPRSPARASLGALRQVARHELRPTAAGGRGGRTPAGRRGGQRLARARVRPRRCPARAQPVAGGRRTPDRRRSGRAVLGPALPGCACGCRRRGDAEHHRPVRAGAAPWRRVGRAVERQRRRAHAPRSSPATAGSSGR